MGVAKSHLMDGILIGGYLDDQNIRRILSVSHSVVREVGERITSQPCRLTTAHIEY